MPREQITYPKHHPDVTDDEAVPAKAPDRANEEPSLHVNWAENIVQVSLNITAERIKRWSDQLDDRVSHSAFYSPTLSRHEVNKLIRILRTARDKAYGRDE